MFFNWYLVTGRGCTRYEMKPCDHTELYVTFHYHVDTYIGRENDVASPACCIINFHKRKKYEIMLEATLGFTELRKL